MNEAGKREKKTTGTGGRRDWKRGKSQVGKEIRGREGFAGRGLTEKERKVKGWRSEEGKEVEAGLVEGMIRGDGGAAIWRRRRPEAATAAAATGRLHTNE